MKYRIIIGWLMLMICGPAVSAPISRQTARQHAMKFLHAHDRTLADDAPYKKPRLRSSMPTDDAFYYVFPSVDDKGFVVVSGDDRTMPILGFTEQGTFDESTMPEGLRFLLKMYEDQIQQLDGSGRQEQHAAHAAAAASHTTRHNVQPLMPTRWNQGEPYNLLCPDFYNYDGQVGGRSATGCVATAVAQVMNYYRFPEKTKRYIPSYKVEYDTSRGKHDFTVPGVAANSVIDWDNMCDVYSGNETEAQQTAVAQLMHWVGVGCKMGYGASSAAFMGNALQALTTYFGYDDGSHMESRGNHTIASWSDLLYSEISTGHPLAFAASNTGGAHAFVLDGYDIDGLFHVNWGWGGLDNGYFRIDVMAPDDNNGIGASHTPDGYNMGQEAIILRLPDDVTAEKPQPRLTVNDWEIRQGNKFFANYINWTGAAAMWDAGIGYVTEEGALQPIGRHETVQLNDGYYMGFEFPVEGLEEGTYRIVPISKRSSAKQWQTHVNPTLTCIEAVVDGDGTVSLSQHPVEDIAISGITFPGNHKKGDRQPVVVSFSNHGEEYFREIHLLASMTNDKGESICRTAVAMVGAGATTASFSFTPDKSGTWNVWLSTDNHGNTILGKGEVDITDQGMPSKHHLRYLSHNISNKSNNVIYGNRMQGKVSIRNEADDTFDGKVKLWLFKLASDGYFYGVSSVMVPMVIEPKKSAQADFYFDHLDYGGQYNMSIIYEEGGDIEQGGLRAMGVPSPGIVYWQQGKGITGMAPATMVYIPATALAVDMTGMGKSVRDVRPNNNPNTLYIFGNQEDVPESLEGCNVVVGNYARHLRLTDGYGFMSPLNFTAGEATYSRQPQRHRWETIALPFAPTEIPDGVAVKSFTEEDTYGTPCFTDVASMDDGIPYLICSSIGDSLHFSATEAPVLATQTVSMAVGTESTRFVGTTVKTSQPDVFVLNEETATFAKADGIAAILPFRAYLVSKTLTEPIVIDSPESIRNKVADTQDEGQMYDLQGRRISTPTKGINIVNHRKVVVR